MKRLISKSNSFWKTKQWHKELGKQKQSERNEWTIFALRRVAPRGRQTEGTNSETDESCSFVRSFAFSQWQMPLELANPSPPISPPPTFLTFEFQLANRIKRHFIFGPLIGRGQSSFIKNICLCVLTFSANIGHPLDPFFALLKNGIYLIDFLIFNSQCKIQKYFVFAFSPLTHFF